MRQKHVPQRSCVGCGETQAKRQMVRVVRTLSGKVQVDRTGKMAGRGAYLCARVECWEKAVQKSALGRALKVELTPEDREELLKYGRAFAAEQDTQPAPKAEGETGS